eukprot:2546878-Amphidinium_carterae.1
MRSKDTFKHCTQPFKEDVCHHHDAEDNLHAVITSIHFSCVCPHGEKQALQQVRHKQQRACTNTFKSRKILESGRASCRPNHPKVDYFPSILFLTMQIFSLGTSAAPASSHVGESWHILAPNATLLCIQVLSFGSEPSQEPGMDFTLLSGASRTPEWNNRIV